MICDVVEVREFLGNFFGEKFGGAVKILYICTLFLMKTLKNSIGTSNHNRKHIGVYLGLSMNCKEVSDR